MGPFTWEWVMQSVKGIYNLWEQVMQSVGTGYAICGNGLCYLWERVM